MDLVRFYSTFSIFFVGLLSTSYFPNISAQPNIAPNKALVGFYENARNRFNNIHILTRLTTDQLNFICSEFTKKEVKAYYPHMVDLVYFDPRSFSNHPTLNLERPLPIPIFACEISNGTTFFVTYMRGNKFYLLLVSDHGNIRISDPSINHTKIMVEAIESKIIINPRLTKINDSVDHSVVQYFKTEEYLENAKNSFKILGSEVLDLCKIFSLEAKDPLATGSTYAYERSTAPLKVHGKEIGPVPCIKCHPTGTNSDTSSFKVFHYFEYIYIETITNDGDTNYEMVSYLPIFRDRKRSRSNNY